MKNFNKLYLIATSLSISILLMSYANNAPNGFTNSPGDGSACGNCHSGGSYGGNVQITGIPTTITPSTAYPVSVIITKTTGTPSRAGFSLKSEVGGANVGTFTAGASNNVSSGYVRQTSPILFSGGTTVTYNFTWTSPATFTNGAAINFYTSAILANGNGSDNGDQAVNGTKSGTFQAAATPLTVTQSSVTNVSCFGGNNGSATVAASGGSGCTYSYTWSNGQSGATATNLSSGTYTVTATCGSSTGTTSVSISQPSVLTFASTSSQNVGCNTQGSVTALASGGTAPYTYAWSNGKTGSTVTVATQGTYFVTATDNKNCTQVTSVSVGNTVVPPSIQLQVSGGLNCISSSATISNTQNQGNYSYQWQAQTGGVISSTTNYSVSSPGTYNVTVTNAANGCTATDLISISENKTNPTVNVSNVNPTITCSSPSTVLDASNSSGTSSPLAFEWTGSGITSGALSSKATVNQGGNFTVKVTDSGNGCTATKIVSVLANTTAPVVTASGGTLTCSQTNVTLQANVNPTGATFQWSGPNFSSIVSSPTVTAAGTYSVTATSPNGCKATSATMVSTNNAPVQVSIQGNTALCAGKTTLLTATSSTNTLKYKWLSGDTSKTFVASTVGNYSVTTTNTTNGCTGTATIATTQAPQPVVTVKNDTLTCSKSSININATTTSNLSNIAWTGPNNFTSPVLAPAVTSPGNYSLTVTNTQGCSAQFAASIFQDKSAPQVSIDGSPIICQGTVAILTAKTSSTGTYLWSNGATSQTINTNQPNSYSVTVTNALGCKGSANVNVTVSPIPNVNVADVKACEGSDATLNAVVTNAPNATFAWTSNTNYTGTNQNAVLKNVSLSDVGKYFVLVTNADGCVGKDTATLSVSPKMNVTLSSKVDCDSTGTVNATITGGTKPYTYKWANSNGASTPVYIKAPATTTLTVTDSYGCIVSSTPVQLTAPTPITLKSQIVDATTGTKNGSIKLVASGGAQPYSYKWSNGEVGNGNLINLGEGKYCITVTDANGCIKTDCYEVKTSKVGLLDQILDNAIRVFPNPVNDYLNIEVSNNVILKEILLFDEKGRLIKVLDGNERKINLSDLPEAIYYLKMNSANAQVTKQILKLR